MNTGTTLFAQLMDFLPWSAFARIVERHGGDPLREVARVYRTVPCDGLCAIDLPRESARYRSLPLGAGRQAVSHGVQAEDQAFDAGRRQRNEGLAYSCRVCPMPDRAGAPTLHWRQLRCRFAGHDLRAGLDDHRPVSVAVSLGTVPHHQVGGKDAYVARPARQYSQRHPHLRRQLGDVNVLDILELERGALYIMDRGYLDFGRLYMMHKGASFLRHTRQVEYASSARLFGF